MIGSPSLDFTGETLTLAPDDRVVLAVPAWAAKDLVPDVKAPDEFRSIVNAHFAHAGAGRRSADDRRDRWHGRMGVRLP